MEKNDKLVTVCLLTYNHVNIVEETIRSIIAQSLKDFEFIISDDYSTDGTWESIQQLSKEDNRIKAVQTPANLGMAGNANYAVSQASCPYIAILHHDDIYRDDVLERWLDIMERHPDVGFVFNSYRLGINGKIDYHLSQEKIDGKVFLEKYLLSGWGCPVRGTAMIRRSCWDILGGMHEKFNLLADVDLWMRLAARWPVGYVAEPLITVRQERPDYYPDEYTSFSWYRIKLLHNIHAANIQTRYDLHTFYGRSAWLKFKLRVSLRTVKCLAYAVRKKRGDLLLNSRDGICAYEMSAVKWIREILIWFHR